ncbi:MAG: hypothetical protein M3461_22505 [Pseudomonadota bacterium]|nr:hypothetical protein [Pseudomonadota bacterium]
MNIRTLIVLGLFTFAPTLASAAPSFPGAQGGGAVSVGGRGGQVIEVTNLNDSDAGSLRACVTTSGPRTCVFRVGGTIQLLSQIEIYNPFLTVAGQTAPGGGILLSGKNISSYTMLHIAANNVIWRYTRIRKGWHPSGAGENTNLGTAMFLSGGSNNSIIDHNSVSWNQDEGIAVWHNGTGPVNNITISSNLVAEGLADHATGYIASGAGVARRAGMTNIDYHHNLTMNEGHRNPAITIKSSRYVNNITYNVQLFDVQVGWPDLSMDTDFIGNLWKAGPLNNGHHEVAAHGTQSIYMSGNKGYNQSNPAGDQWLMANRITGQNGPEVGPVPSGWRRATPMANTTHPIIAEPVAGLEASILPIVGASRRLDCNGNWVANRDTVDTRLINQYQTNTGITALPSTEASVGGFPVIAGGTPCTDTDHDGMPDVWETARALNPNNPADRNAIAKSGYTNLEDYLAGTGSSTPATPPPERKCTKEPLA